MIDRRRAREIALEILYQVEVGGSTADEVLALRQWERKQQIPDFTFRLVKGVSKNKTAIDRFIENSVENWKLERLSIIDKNIIRISIYEMIHEKDIPFSVSINESVELAKKFGTMDSGKFVNGVLGKIAQDIRGKLKQRRKNE